MLPLPEPKCVSVRFTELTPCFPVQGVVREHDDVAAPTRTAPDESVDSLDVFDHVIASDVLSAVPLEVVQPDLRLGMSLKSHFNAWMEQFCGPGEGELQVRLGMKDLSIFRELGEYIPNHKFVVTA